MRSRRGEALSAGARARGARGARSRRHHPLRPGERPLRRRLVEHGNLVLAQRGPLPLRADGGADQPLRVRRRQRPAHHGPAHRRRGAPHHLLPLLHRRPAARGQGEGMGGRHGLGHSRDQRRQPARRARSRHAARRLRAAAAGLRDRRRLRGDGERARHQVAGGDRVDAPLHRRVRAGHRADAGRAAARHHRERALGGASPRQHRGRGRVDRVPAAGVRAAHQPVVPRMLHAGHRAGRHRGLRHRPRGPLRLLQRHLAHVGVRCAAERRAAAPLRRGLRAHPGEQGAAEAGRDLRRADAEAAPPRRRVRRAALRGGDARGRALRRVPRDPLPGGLGAGRRRRAAGGDGVLRGGAHLARRRPRVDQAGGAGADHGGRPRAALVVSAGGGLAVGEGGEPRGVQS